MLKDKHTNNKCYKVSKPYVLNIQGNYNSDNFTFNAYLSPS